MKILLRIVFAFVSHALADDSSTAYVDLATTPGESSQNASGFIYR
jgi:hypothetical protein